jgi:hypothetical protein
MSLGPLDRKKKEKLLDYAPIFPSPIASSKTSKKIEDKVKK